MKPIELKELMQDGLGPLRWALTDETIKQTSDGEMYPVIRQVCAILDNAQHQIEALCERIQNGTR